MQCTAMRHRPYRQPLLKRRETAWSTAAAAPRTCPGCMRCLPVTDRQNASCWTRPIMAMPGLWPYSLSVRRHLTASSPGLLLLRPEPSLLQRRWLHAPPSVSQLPGLGLSHAAAWFVTYTRNFRIDSCNRFIHKRLRLFLLNFRAYFL